MLNSFAFYLFNMVKKLVSHSWQRETTRYSEWDLEPRQVLGTYFQNHWPNLSM